MSDHDPGELDPFVAKLLRQEAPRIDAPVRARDEVIVFRVRFVGGGVHGHAPRWIPKSIKIKRRALRALP